MLTPDQPSRARRGHRCLDHHPSDQDHLWSDALFTVAIAAPAA